MEHEGDRARLAAIVQSSHDAILAKTTKGRITSWNPGAGRMYGYTAVEAIGRNVSMLLPPDRPEEVNELLERLKLGERIEDFETVRQAKDGQRIDGFVDDFPAPWAERPGRGGFDDRPRYQ